MEYKYIVKVVFSLISVAKLPILLVMCTPQYSQNKKQRFGHFFVIP